MKVKIARSVRDMIVSQAEQVVDKEICGLLIGKADRIDEAVPAGNVAPDPRRMFEIDPAVLLAEHRRARESGVQVVGHYHSHPGGKPLPSLRDAASACHDGAIWLIVGDGGALAAFQAVADGIIAGHFNPVELEVF